MRLLKVLRQPSASIMIFCCFGECHFGLYWCAAAAYDVTVCSLWSELGGRAEKRNKTLSPMKACRVVSPSSDSVAHIVASPARNHSLFFGIINLHWKKDKVRRNYFFILDITCTRHTVHTIHFKLLCTLCILFHFYCSVCVVEIKKSFTLCI